ncbi:uroporphyrinogen-III synthase [uncultured Shewanella sp.]|uniref:uroporphyrinogen-III synthase n=1 Tax=uncultured Shewanella sp. TaxID=173975 RepID=UPI0026221969|nr:uroporphyrinogen-III synthase [uncultured Shewanella sp.]
MKVLLTRPEGKNHAMAVALEKQGIPYVITPLIKILPTFTSNSQDRFAHADAIIFVSTNAVTFAKQLHSSPWPTDIPYFAVGQATQKALLALGIQATAPKKGAPQTSEGVLALPALASIKNKNILIVRGTGGRETLADTLKQRQAQVTYWEVYQRVPVELKANQITNQWQIAKIDTIIVTSGEILSNLIKLVPNELFSWLQTCHIIVPSARVEQLAFQHGLVHVTNAKAANANAMISTLIT